MSLGSRENNYENFLFSVILGKMCFLQNCLLSASHYGEVEAFFFFLKLLNPGPDTQCETIVTLPFEPVYSSIKKK